MAWSDDAEEPRRIKNDVGGQLEKYGLYAEAQHYRLPDTVLGGDAPATRLIFQPRKSLYTFIEPAVWLLHCRNQLPQ